MLQASLVLLATLFLSMAGDCACNGHRAVLPGVRGVIQGAAVVYMGNHHLDPIVKKIEAQNVKIPQTRVTVDSVVGHITVTLSDMLLSQVQVGSAGVEIASDIGIKGDFAAMNAVITLNWHWQTDGIIKISDSGSANIAMSEAHIGATVKIDEVDGKLAGDDYKNDINMGQWKITLSRSGFDWFYDLFIHSITQTVEQAATNAVSMKMREEVNKLAQKYFALLPTDVSFINGSGLQIDSALVSNPIIRSSGASFDFVGTGLSIKKPSPPPFSCNTKLPTSENATKMVQVFLSQYVFNSLAWSYWSEGNFDLTFKNSDIPKDSPLHLNTSSFGQVIPKLYQKYPNQLMQVQTATRIAPRVLFTETGLNATLATDMTFYVVDTYSLVEAFTISASVNTSLRLYTRGNYLHGQVKAVNVALALIHSSIGTFSITSLQSLFQFGLTAYVSPQVDKILATGVELPTISSHIVLKNSLLLWHSHYVSFLTDYVYKNTSHVAHAWKLLAE